MRGGGGELRIGGADNSLANPVHVNLATGLKKTIDNVDVARMSKGEVSLDHVGITASVVVADCTEINCVCFNSILVWFSLNTTDVTWTFALFGSMNTGGTFVSHIDVAGAAIVYTTDVSGWFVVNGVPNFVKVVPVKVDAGASTCSVTVMPFNS